MENRVQDELCGCLIGLARTCSTNPPTANTDGLLLAGLVATMEDAPFTIEQLVRLTQRIRSDKNEVSPNCAACVSRCGKNDDYDMSRLYAAPDEVRQVKLDILSGLQALAQRGAMSGFIYDALFALAEDWDVQTLAWYRDEALRLLG